jgi:uncharacterized protein YbaP (TraB family)
MSISFRLIWTPRITRIFNIAVLVVLLNIPGVSIADPAIWKINSKNNSIYLFGSIHVANKSMYPLGKKVEDAFTNSDVLVVEVDETKVDQVKLQELMMSQGFYPGTDTIYNHINADTLKLLQRFLAETGIPYITIARMKPGIIAITLTIAKIIKMGYSLELGIDRHFMKRSRGKKEIQPLETSIEQMKLILSFSNDDLVLRHTLVSLDKLEEMITSLIRAWKNGDENNMEKLMITDQLSDYPEFKNIMKRLIDDRNVTMAINIHKMINDNKDYFVVVGAAHLIGDKGIVSLLRKKGLEVDRL